MKIIRWFMPVVVALSVAGCASIPLEELRPKLAAANVDVSVKSSINQIQFFTRAQEIGQGVANSGTGLIGAVVGIAITAAGAVDPIVINEGFSLGVANAIKGKIAHTRANATESYRLDVTDGAVFRTASADGGAYVLNYAVALSVINVADGKAISAVTCVGSGPDRLSEQQWRNAHDTINAIRKQIIERCSTEFIAKLAPADAFEPARPRKKGK